MDALAMDTSNVVCAKYERHVRVESSMVVAQKRQCRICVWVAWTVAGGVSMDMVSRMVATT
eukprot:1153013-Pelagomonas_calceolata.AAC.3